MSEWNTPAETPASNGEAASGAGQRSGFEVAESAMNKAGKVATATGHGLVRIYGLVLALLGLWGLFAVPDFAGKAAFLVLAGYGVYLLFGGSWVIY